MKVACLLSSVVVLLALAFSFDDAPKLVEVGGQSILAVSAAPVGFDVRSQQVSTVDNPIDQPYSIALERLIDGKATTQEIEHLLSLWGQDDPDAALAWLEDQSPAEDFYVFYEVLFARYMETDFEAAGYALLNVAAPDVAADALAQYVYQFVQQEPLQALHWTNNIIDPTQRRSAQDYAVRSWLAVEPHDALAFLMFQSDFDGDVSRTLFSYSGEVLGAQGDVGSFDLLESIPQQYQGDFVYSLLQTWPEDSVQIALAGINRIEPSALKERAVAGVLLGDTQKLKYADAFALAQTVATSQTKSQLLAATFEAWVSVEPVAAKAALRQVSGLSQLDRQLLLERLAGD